MDFHESLHNVCSLYTVPHVAPFCKTLNYAVMRTHLLEFLFFSPLNLMQLPFIVFCFW